MQGYNFTERVRRSLALGREEAARLHHEYVGTEHLLLGLLREGEGVATAVLENLNIKPEAVRQTIEETVQTGKAAASGPDLPYTSRAKKVLELAMTEARDLGQSYVGTEHLLLGLLREEKGIGAQVLVKHGVTLEKARVSVISILGSATPGNKTPGGHEPDYLFGYSQPKAVGAGPARWLLTISAIPAWIIGLMLIFNARAFEYSMGIIVDDKSETIAQAQGAILLGLGFVNWLARGVTDRAALWAILYGNFVVQALSFALVLRALVRGFIPTAGFGAAALHLVLGAAFAWQLRRLSQTR